MEAKNIEEAAKIIYGDYKKQYFEQFFLLPVWDDTASPVKDKYLETAEKVCQLFEAEITWKAREPEIVEAHKAGIKEVVKVVEALPRFGGGSGVSFVGLGEKWQTFLKEEGITEETKDVTR